MVGVKSVHRFSRDIGAGKAPRASPGIIAIRQIRGAQGVQVGPNIQTAFLPACCDCLLSGGKPVWVAVYRTESTKRLAD
jgi:hypothetical protein